MLANKSPKFLAAAGACQLSLEHATTLRLALAANAPNSATALLRLQYEALLRGAWLLYAAPEGSTEKLTATLNPESEKSAKNMAGPTEMLKALAARGTPPGLLNPLQQFDDVSRAALNSYVHTGLHPLQRFAQGFPQTLAEHVVLNANGLMHMAYRFLATLSGSQEQVNITTNVYVAFADCLPVIVTPAR